MTTVTCERIHVRGTPKDCRFALLTGKVGATRGDLGAVARRHLGALCEELMGVGGALLESPRGPTGVGGWSQIRLSLAYAENSALIGAAVGRSLGVDLIEMQPVAEWRELSELYLSRESRAQLMRVSQNGRALKFCEAWARMEAGLKCTGQSLSEGAVGASSGMELVHLPLNVPPPLYAVAALAVNLRSVSNVQF